MLRIGLLRSVATQRHARKLPRTLSVTLTTGFQRGAAPHIGSQAEEETPGTSTSVHVSQNNGTDGGQREGRKAGGKEAKSIPGFEVGARDERIAFRFVKFIDPETGDLSPMTPTNVVLRRLLPDKEVRRRYSVQLVSLSPEPIVRLVNTGEQYRKEKEKKQRAQQRAKLSGEKEIQLTWDTEGPDHQRKLDQARESLAEGMRVDLIHAPKRGTRHRMTKEDMALCAQSTLDALADVGKERREKQVGPRITAIYLEPLAATVTENEVLIPLGASQAIFQRRVSEVQKVLAAGGKVKLTFAEEKKSKDEVEKNGLPEDTREGAPWSGGLVKLITKELKQQTAGEEKWTRKRKEAFVDAIITKLGSEAQEWKPRDDWKASTTLYLRKSGSD